MTRRRIISALAEMPLEDIKAELDEVRSQRARLEMEEDLLTKALALRHWNADASQTTDRDRATNLLRPNVPKHRRENVSANALNVVQEADEPLLPADVHDRLANQGIDADLNAIRVALRRWVDRGRLEREGRYYRTPKQTLLSPNGGEHQE